MDRRQFMSAGALLAGWRVSVSAFAQGHVARKFIVPGSAGTGGDAMARYMARSLEKSTGVPCVVDNRSGAGGVIGTEAAAKALPDGSTVLVTSANHYVLPWIYDRIPYKTLEDFVPIAGFGSSTLLMVVAPNSPYATVQDAIKEARSGNADLSYSSAGNGTLSHICGALLNSMAGIRLRHVPYKSASQGLLDVSAGVVTIGFLGVAGAMPLVSGGKLKIIAVTSKNRSVHLPQIPSISEHGLDGYDIDSPFLALAPRGTPAGFLAKLEQGFLAATQEPAYEEFCKSQGLESQYRESAAGLAATMPKELLKWKNLIAMAQAKAS